MPSPRRRPLSGVLRPRTAGPTTTDPEPQHEPDPEHTPDHGRHQPAGPRPEPRPPAQPLRMSRRW